MERFIIANWITIVLVVVALCYVVYLIFAKKWEQLRVLAYKLMLLAEKNITGTAQGQNRFNTVFEQIYSLLPTWFRFFIPVDTLKAKLQKWYTEIEDYMDNGVVDGSTNV